MFEFTQIGWFNPDTSRLIQLKSEKKEVKIPALRKRIEKN